MSDPAITTRSIPTVTTPTAEWMEWIFRYSGYSS